MINISGQSFSMLGDLGAVSWENAIFSGESLLLDANFRSKISGRSASWSPRTLQLYYILQLQVPSNKQWQSPLSRLYERVTSSLLLKIKMADGVVCRVPVWACYATNLIKIAGCTKGVFIYFSFK